MARAKASAPSKKKARPPARSGQGGGLLRLLTALAVVAGISYGALRVPLGGRTVVERAREELPWRALAAKLGVGATAPARPKAASKIAGARQRSHLPREQLTKADRDALDRLVP